MIKISFEPKYILTAIFFISLITYSAFQARFLILGPQISISNPTHGLAVPAQLVFVEGRAKNVAWLSLNDRQIFTNEEGYWSEKLLVSEGLSITTVKARDRFG